MRPAPSGVFPPPHPAGTQAPHSGCTSAPDTFMALRFRGAVQVCVHEALSDKNTRNGTQGYGRVAGRAARAGDDGGLQSNVGLRSRAGSSG